MVFLAAPSSTNDTVQIAAGGGTQGMEPMHQPSAPDMQGMDRLTGVRR